MKITYEMSLFNFLLAENQLRPISHINVCESDFEELLDTAERHDIFSGGDTDWFGMDHPNMSITVYKDNSVLSWSE